MNGVLYFSKKQSNIYKIFIGIIFMLYGIELVKFEISKQCISVNILK